MWLVYSQDGKTRILLRKGLVPSTVQEAVQRNNGKAYFNVTVEGKKVTWGEKVSGLIW